MAFDFSLFEQLLLELLLFQLDLHLLSLELRLFDPLELFFMALRLRDHRVNADHVDSHLLDEEVLFLDTLHEDLLLPLLPFLGLQFLTLVLARSLTSLLLPQEFLLLLALLLELD